MEIVGVVQSHKYLTVQEPPVATVYYPLEQEYRPRMTLAARVDGPARGTVDPIVRAMSAVNPRIPVYRLMLLSAHLDESIAADRLTASPWLCAGNGAVASTIGVNAWSILAVCGGRAKSASASPWRAAAECNAVDPWRRL